MNDSSMLWTAAAAIGISIVLVIGFLLIRGGEPAERAPVALPPIIETDHVRGNRDAQVVLVEYFDFQCPACGAYAPIIKALEADYGERVAFVARYFPLPQHENGMTAALAAEAAGQQGKYWEMHDLLFANRETWSAASGSATEIFEGYAAQIGLDVAQFRADRASEVVRARVERDYQEGKTIGVDSTPSFFLNGVPLDNPRSIENFRALLDEALAAQQVAGQ